jgi:hypothetical protein
VIQLLGYRRSPDALRPGDTFTLTTYWRATGDVPPQLAQFTHALRDDGSIVSQQDRLGLTSSRLVPGDVFVQRHHLALPADLSPGAYPLTIGLFQLSEGTRLRIVDADEDRGDRLWLEPIVVQ